MSDLYNYALPDGLNSSKRAFLIESFKCHFIDNLIRLAYGLDYHVY